MITPRWSTTQKRNARKHTTPFHGKGAAERRPPATITFDQKSSESCEADMGHARDLFERAVEVDDKHQHAYHNWAMGEWLLAKDVDRARELFQQGIWSGPTSAQAAKSFSSWAHMEAVEDRNIELSRSLYSCAARLKPRSTKLILNWAKDERAYGDSVRANELERLAGAILAEPRQGVSKLSPSEVAAEIDSLSIETALAEGVEEFIEFIEKWNKYYKQRRRTAYMWPRADAAAAASLDSRKTTTAHTVWNAAIDMSACVWLSAAVSLLQVLPLPAKLRLRAAER